MSKLNWQTAGGTMSFAKVGTYGPAGSGKTYTLSRVAVGLMQRIGKKEAYMIDTETGSTFVAPLFKERGFMLNVLPTRAFKDVVAALKELQNAETVFILDSVSHIWDELMNSYAKKKDEAGRGIDLSFPDWRFIKAAWQEFNDIFLNSRLHCFVAGRLQDVYEMKEVRQGKYEIVAVDDRLKAEKYFGYEPSLLFRMQAVKDPEVTAKLAEAKGAKERQALADELRRKTSYVHVAEVLKDRSDLLNGKSFVNPGFEDFLPHFEFLGINSHPGTHIGVDTSRDSGELFPDGEARAAELKRRRDEALGEIKGTLISFWPGQSAAEKKLKADAIHRLFGVRGWEKVESYDLLKLEEAITPPDDRTPSPLEQACVSLRELAEAGVDVG